VVGLPVDTVKIVTRGTMQSAQSWSTSVFCAIGLTGGSWSVGDMQAFASDVDAFLRTLSTAIHGFWSTTTQYEGVDVYFYPTGTTHSTQLGTKTTSAPIVGVGGDVIPNQCSLVTTYLTDVPGRSGRGRGYWPATGCTLDTAGQVGNTECSAMAGDVKNYLSSLKGYTSVPNHVSSLLPVVASFTKNQVNDLTHVRCDSVIDTQRRRRDQSAAEHTVTSSAV